MTEEQKQKYIGTMKEKAFAYAENVLSDIKNFMPKDEYEETLKDFAQAFICGADAAIATVKELKAQKGEEL
jgi:hypothetical protein